MKGRNKYGKSFDKRLKIRGISESPDRNELISKTGRDLRSKNASVLEKMDSPDRGDLRTPTSFMYVFDNNEYLERI
jgi:hypothetical protein